jgi:hypothetical protein
MNISEKHLGYTLNMQSKKGSHTSKKKKGCQRRRYDCQKEEGHS